MRILFLDIDTLRADHLGCYGYNRNTSPNIDSIAEDSVKFENYYCSDAPCLPSRSALMSGQFGIHTGVVGHGGTAADPRLEGADRGFQSSLYSKNCLPGFLRKQGYHTVSISSFAERHSAWNFYAGFNEIRNSGGCGMEPGEIVTDEALKWIEQNAEKDNWFLHINWWDPHTPYRTPMDYNPFENEPAPEWLTEEILQEHRKMSSPHGAQEIMMYTNEPIPQYPKHQGEIRNMEELKYFFDGYDSGVKYADEQIGIILDALKNKGIDIDDLAIIVTADHGENLGELGLYAEHATADNITCKVPMIIKWPECLKGHTDKGFHYSLDLLPTLADLFKGKSAGTEMDAKFIPGSGGDQKPDWDGKSYFESLKTGKETGHDELILSQCAHVCQRSVRWDKYIYIRTYHDGYHLYPKEMLFNLDKDPYEQNNIAEERPELCKEGAHKLMNWHDKMMFTQPEGYSNDPMWTVISEGGPTHAKGYLSQYCERLKKTGREWAIPELKKRHPNEFTI
jgi:choline-sulfatase